jgi:hypothetical protein
MELPALAAHSSQPDVHVGVCACSVHVARLHADLVVRAVCNMPMNE